MSTRSGRTVNGTQRYAIVDRQDFDNYLEVSPDGDITTYNNTADAQSAAKASAIPAVVRAVVTKA